MTNEKPAKTRLKYVTRRLERIYKLEENWNIAKQWLKDGILEPVPECSTGPVMQYTVYQAVFNQSELKPRQITW